MFIYRNTYRYVSTYVSLDRYIPSFYHLRNSLVAKSITTAQILASSTILQSEETVFLTEMVDSSSGQGKYKMNVEHLMGFPVGSVVKNLPANARDTVQSLGREDPLEKEIATHSSILAWKIPWTEEPDGLPSARVAQSQICRSD